MYFTVFFNLFKIVMNTYFDSKKKGFSDSHFENSLFLFFFLCCCFVDNHDHLTIKHAIIDLYIHIDPKTITIHIIQHEYGKNADGVNDLILMLCILPHKPLLKKHYFYMVFALCYCAPHPQRTCNVSLMQNGFVEFPDAFGSPEYMVRARLSLWKSLCIYW